MVVLVAPQRDGYSMEDTFGKSSHEIVKMGRDEWYDWYVEKAGGESTMSMSFGQGIYGWALREENNKVLAQKPKEKQLYVTQLRKLMYDFRTHCVNMGRVNTGGGTMWTPVYAGIEAEVEEIIVIVMDDKAERPKTDEKKASQKMVWDQLKKIDKSFTRNMDEIKETLEWMKMTPEEVTREVNGAKSNFGMSVPLIAKLSAKQKPYVFGFYFRSTEMLEFGI